MERVVYTPDVYEGKDPYIQISFHPEDKQKVMPYLESMDRRGFRFWLNDGIAPGMETDEIIAEHIENCEYFMAFLSSSYINSLDMIDELNYSRDTDKEYLLVYLENVVLPSGLDMRFMRAQSIAAYCQSTEKTAEQLLKIQGADRFFGVTDPKLKERAESVFQKMEMLYPEHKVFALDAIDKQLSKKVSELYIQAGYPNVERLMLDYGFSTVSTQEARALRNSVLHAPGYEPDGVKNRIDYIMKTLEQDYPGKVIGDLLSQTHKSIYSSLLGLSIWLGYDTAADMLNAYGFSGVKSQQGRTELDYDRVLQQLKERYQDKVKPASLTELFSQNSDIKGNLKTLINRSGELYGMPLLAYLKKIGMIVPAEKEERTTQTAKNREAIIEQIKQNYVSQSLDYGTYQETEESLNQIVIKKNAAGQIIAANCNDSNEHMKLPYGIEIIGKEAFAGQSSLTELILPPSVTEIRDGAFMDCSGLEELVLPEGIEKIGNHAFENCISLKRAVFPATLRNVGNEAFSGCEILDNVTIYNPRISIQQDAFDGCPYCLENLQCENASPAEYFELKVDKKNQAKIVSYTGNEKIVVIPGMIGGHPVVSLEKGCFTDNQTVEEVYISDDIPNIKGDVFRGCVNMRKVHMSESAAKLTGTVFSGCSSLAEANIPDQMTELPRGIFKDCPLESLYIGKGLSVFNPEALYKGEMDIATGIYRKKRSLQNLDVDEKNENFTAEGTMLLSKDRSVLIAELGDTECAVIPEGVTEIGPQAFEKLGILSQVVFPRTLKKIGLKAFAGTGLQTADIPDSVEEIGSQAFSYCRQLESLELCEGLKIIGQQAFEGCPIASVYIPKTVESMGIDSFLAISTYQGQTPQQFCVDSANDHILTDGMALYQKTEDGMILQKAYRADLRTGPDETGTASVCCKVADGTTEIAPYAFARCSSLSAVELPDSLQSIGDMAFWDCTGLKDIHIPEACKSVSAKAFFGITPEMI